MALKLAVMILVSALLSVVVESWGVRHRLAEFTGAVCGVLAQQMIPPKLSWKIVAGICVVAGVLTALIALIER